MFGFNWLDLIIICILVIGILDGINKGFLISFLNIGGVYLSLYTSRFLMKLLTNYIIKNTTIYDNLKKIFDKRMSSVDLMSSTILNLFKVNGNNISNGLTIIFIDTASFILIFFILTIILNVFKGILKARLKKSSLRHTDKLLGGIIGFIITTLFIFVFFALITPLTTVMKKDSSFMVAIETSQIAKYFFYFNFIIPWLHKINKVNTLSEVIMNIL